MKIILKKIHLVKQEGAKMKEDYFLDNYEKHLLRNGSEVAYENTTKEQREKDLEELLTALKKGEENADNNTEKN